MVLFETERMVIRRFTESDADSFFHIHGNAEVMRYIRPAKKREQSDDFLKENINYYKQGSVLGRYAVFTKSDPRFVGTFSFLYLDGETDFHIGYALVPEAWGLGYATELVQFGKAYYFIHTQKQYLFAITQPENQSSQNVLLKSGFLKKDQIEARGERLDVFYTARNNRP